MEYSYRAGASYDTYLNHPDLLGDAENFNPHYIIVILAGNSINDAISTGELYQKCRDFYQLLRDRLPDATIIAAQPEMRYYQEGNKWGAPTELDYKAKRNAFLSFLRRFKGKDSILLVGGPNCLDNQNYYRHDGVPSQTKVWKFTWKS